MDVERLPFDQYQRYRLVSDLIGAVRPAGRRLRVLDVGGRTALLREFLPEDRVDLVDMEASESAGLVLGDGSRLPFQDRSFDVVAAFDTLEHVPPPRRAAFVAECARVSSGHVFLAGPYDAPRVAEAEELLDAFLTRKLRVEHRYLREHRSYGLPERAATEAGLAAAGYSVASVGHGNLDRWLALMCVEFYVDIDPTLRALGERLFKFYNASLYASDHLPPVYRHVVVGARPGLPLPEAAAVLGAPGAPPEAVPALLPLAQELLAFDHDRDALAPELERLHAVVRDLEEDLRQHDLAAATLETDLAGHRATVSALRGELEVTRRDADAQRDALLRDLDAHRASLAELQGELPALRAVIGARDAEAVELRAALAARAATEGELRREIDARGAALDGLRAALAAEQAEVERHRELERRLERSLEEHREDVARHGRALAERDARVDDLHAELTAALERARAAEDEVDALRADAARLVSLLRSRAGNLRRALGLRKFGDSPGG